MLRALFEAYLRHRFAWLLGLLIAVVGVDPVLDAMGARWHALEWMLAFSLLVALVGVRRSRAHRVLVLGSSAALFVSLASYVIAFGWEPAVARAALGVCGIWMAGIVLSVVIAPGQVDSERICAALCVYLLAGLAFGGFFASLDAVAPGSLGSATSTEPLGIDEAVYFSFVTLATLGYVWESITDKTVYISLIPARGDPPRSSDRWRAACHVRHVQRRIIGFHRDEEGHWVADLDCGHARHVRHTPPLTNRPWVLEEASRAERLGRLLECARCAALEWPAGFEAYRRTPVFESATIPAALRADHATKAGVWARIHVLSGRLRFRMQEPAREEELSPARDGIIPPQARHRVEPLGDVAFFIEFHRRAPTRA